MHVMQWKQSTQEVVSDMTGICRIMKCVKLEACFGPCVACISLAYGVVRRRSLHVDVRYGDLRCHRSKCINVQRCTVRCRLWWPWPLTSHCVQRRILLIHTWAYTCLRLETGLQSVGFMTQRASRHPLPTGHHSNDLVPLPAGTIPDDNAVLRNVAWPPPPDMPGNYCRRCWMLR